VVNDYEYVMPLPWRKKLGIKYLFQPDLTPILGIFGKKISRELVEEVLAAIPQRFKLWDISLNHLNSAPNTPYPIYRRSNYVLSLKEDYEQLKKRYNSNCVRNLKKATQSGCVVRKQVDIEDVIDLSREQFKTFTDFDEANFNKLALIFNQYQQKHHGVTYGVYVGKKLLASAAFLFTNKRAYYWLVGNDPAAKEVSASFLLLDNFIKENAGTDLLLDFEGSDSDAIAKFYKSFGATDESYTTIFYSRLPGILKMFKKDPYKH
jgi:hypothetical protein